MTEIPRSSTSSSFEFDQEDKVGQKWIIKKINNMPLILQFKFLSEKGKLSKLVLPGGQIET